MKKWHNGLKVLALILSLFLAFPCSIVSAAAKPNIKIKHDPPKDYVPGFRIFLDTEIKKKSDVLVARCYFKTKKDKNLVFVDMVPKGNPGYQATLPAPWLGSEYVEYAFVVVNKDKEVIRTQMFKMKERETAAATTWKEATEVKEIPLDKAQEAVERYEAVKNDLVREYKDKLPKHQIADNRGKLDVLTEFSNPSIQVKGFYDNMIVTTVSDSQKYGVLAEGLYTPTEIAAAGGGSAIMASTGAVTAGTISATGAIGLGTIGLAALGVGGVAALAGGGGGGGGGSSGGSSGGSGGGGGTGGLSDVTVDQTDITLTVFDNTVVDGDTIDLILNGVTLLNDYDLLGPPGLTLPVTLNSGNNNLVVFAVDEGGDPPGSNQNTAALQISNVISGNPDQNWQLSTGETATLTISAP